jgi:hypothetical protein
MLSSIPKWTRIIVPEHRLYATKTTKKYSESRILDPNDPGRLSQPPGDPLNTKNEPTIDTIVTDGHQWAIFRFDDHANTYLVRTCATREEAETIAYDLEKLGHKQHFYVKNVKYVSK